MTDEITNPIPFEAAAEALSLALNEAQVLDLVARTLGLTTQLGGKLGLGKATLHGVIRGRSPEFTARLCVFPESVGTASEEMFAATLLAFESQQQGRQVMTLQARVNQGSRRVCYAVQLDPKIKDASRDLLEPFLNLDSPETEVLIRLAGATFPAYPVAEFENFRIIAVRLFQMLDNPPAGLLEAVRNSD